MERILEPEWLDELPPEDPKAVRSRRDLKRLNWWMRHESLVADALLRYSKGKSWRRIVDLGAGDGTFALGLARRMVPDHPKIQVVLVDRQPCMRAETRDAFQSLGCTVRQSRQMFLTGWRTPPPKPELSYRQSISAPLFHRGGIMRNILPGFKAGGALCGVRTAEDSVVDAGGEVGGADWLQFRDAA